MSISPHRKQAAAPFPGGLNWCFSTLGCSDLQLAQQVQLAQSWGIGKLELRGVGGMVDFPRYASQFEWESPSGVSCMGGADTGVAICAMGSSLRLSDTQPELEKGLAEYAHWMDFFGCPCIRIFDGDLAAGGNAMESAWRTLDAWELLRERHGWKFSAIIETHSSLFRAEDIGRLFSRGHPHVRLLWDAHNCWRQTGESPLKTWQAVRQWTQHIHVKDSIAVPSDEHAYTYVLPFQGGFPLGELVQALRADDFAGVVSLEWEWHWHRNLPTLDVALAALAQGVRAADVR